MKRPLLVPAILMYGCQSVVHDPHDNCQNNLRSRFVCVFGDWPYSTTLLGNAPLLLNNSVNNDPDVKQIIHVGDIHSGSMPCTGAGLNPIPATSNPSWNQGVFNIFQQFKSPVVYTPGDNEWTDCHKTKEGSSGDPLKELAAVRSLFPQSRCDAWRLRKGSGVSGRRV